MSPATAAALAERLIQQAACQHDGFAIVLHGGEPLLLGYERMAAFLRRIRCELNSDKYPISLQTNGALISGRFLDLFSETRTSVAVSIDGPPPTNDLARLDHRGRSTYSTTVHGLSLLASHPDHNFLFAGTLSVIHPETDPRQIYYFLKELGSPSIDFLLQDGNHDRLPSGKAGFATTEYGEWLLALFDAYLADPFPVPIRILDDLLRLLLGGRSVKEGVGQEYHGILVVETDGEVRKNDTLKASFNGADRFSASWNARAHALSDVLSSKEFLRYSGIHQPTSNTCRRCRLLSVCGGGMPLYRWSSEGGYDNPSVYCHDHAILINYMVARLQDFGLGNQLSPPLSLAHVSTAQRA